VQKAQVHRLERGLAYDNPSNLVQNRVSEIQSQIPANSQGRITMGVAVVEDANGVRSVLVNIEVVNKNWPRL